MINVMGGVVVSPAMSALTDRLRADLVIALKARDELTTGTIRMALAAVRTEEVSGTTARELSDDEVVVVLTREVKKRKEAAEAFAGAGRVDSARREQAEGEVLQRYLPAQLGDAELADLVRQALAGGSFSGPNQLGPAMKVARAVVGSRADGGRIAAEVRRQL
jgi:uncharacterized protein YqeY